MCDHLLGVDMDYGGDTKFIFVSYLSQSRVKNGLVYSGNFKGTCPEPVYLFKFCPLCGEALPKPKRFIDGEETDNEGLYLS